MGKQHEILIPDIGGAQDVDVIEVLVAVGDTIEKDDALVTLESDKASMDIPSPVSGVVSALSIAVGDKVSEGSKVLTVDLAESQASQQASDATDNAQSKDAAGDAASTAESKTSPDALQAQPSESASPAEPTQQSVEIPDIGTTDEVDVIEVSVAAGDSVRQDDTLITLEGDKATMDIPSPYDGEIQSVTVAVGDKVKQGHVILTMMAMPGSKSAAKASDDKSSSATSAAPKTEQAAAHAAPATPAQAPVAAKPLPTPSGGLAYAGPAVRRFARELGVDLTRVGGSGRKGRILKSDVQAFVKAQLQGSGAGVSASLEALAGLTVAAAKPEKFDKFGETETVALSKIKKISGNFLHRNWLRVPHVTQFDETDITELEVFRKQHKAAALKDGVRLTPLAFLMKAAVVALKAFPEFNASLDHSGEHIILKKYYNIGVAVDTPNGLVVPVIKQVDEKGVMALARELGEISSKAREKGLTPSDMDGSTFTISSLGGIGGTAFTPIVNLPNVCILGVSKSVMKPVYDGEQFVPKLMLPVSLSYDHRVIDGASGARFTRYLCECIADLRHAIL